MIKNIYDKVNNKYQHEYYCDCCFNEISEYGEILRNERAIKLNIFDLCKRCVIEWNDKLDKLGEFDKPND